MEYRLQPAAERADGNEPAAAAPDDRASRFGTLKGVLQRVAVLCLVVYASPALAQLRPPAPPAAVAPPENPAGPTTLVELEILIPAIGIDPLKAQQWRFMLQDAKIDASFKQPLPSDKPSVTELARGSIRIVRAQGQLNPDNTVTFPGKKFELSDSRQLANWLEELKAFGSQGSPVGRPQYGLSATQFEDLVHQLAVKVTESTKDATVADALSRIPASPDYALIFSDEAQQRRDAFANAVCHEELQGLSSGAALAYLLSQQRMGFRPLRTPGGEIQLLVNSSDRIENPWPIGGDMPQNIPRDRVFPRLFEFVETGFTNVALPTVLDGVEKQTDIRILIDRAGCEAQGIDLSQIGITQPVKKTAWTLIVSSSVARPGLVLNYRLDEAGTGFLFVEPYRARVPTRRGPVRSE